MAQINKEIKDLKDPLKQTGDMFRNFFKDIVDAMREVIIKWLAFKAVMAGVSAISGGATEIPASGMDIGYSKAHGGVIPHIKSFQRFSRGGMTSRPTMAILGDNPSGKELVIPSENIKSDEASGYLRESGQPINILNVLTEDDIINVMAQTKGQRVIVNTIGADLRKKGSTYRSYNA
jgi:hypothetical protein